MLRAALRYPLAGDRADEALVGGWALYLLAGLLPLVPLVPLIGYYVRVLGASAAADSAPPDVADPVDLLVQGTAGTVVAGAFIAVPAALWAGTAGGLAAAPTPTSLLEVVLILAGGTVLLLVTLCFLYLLPAALAAYGLTGDWRIVADRTLLGRAGRDGAYFYRFWEGTVLLVAGTALAAWLWSRGGVVRAAAPLPAVYLQLAACRCYGVGMGAATREYLAAVTPDGQRPTGETA